MDGWTAGMQGWGVLRSGNCCPRSDIFHPSSLAFSWKFTISLSINRLKPLVLWVKSKPEMDSSKPHPRLFSSKKSDKAAFNKSPQVSHLILSNINSQHAIYKVWRPKNSFTYVGLMCSWLKSAIRFKIRFGKVAMPQHSTGHKRLQSPIFHVLVTREGSLYGVRRDYLILMNDSKCIMLNTSFKNIFLVYHSNRLKICCRSIAQRRCAWLLGCSTDLYLCSGDV